MGMSYNNLNHMSKLYKMVVKFVATRWYCIFKANYNFYHCLDNFCPARHEFELSNVVVDWTCCVLAWLCKSLSF